MPYIMQGGRWNAKTSVLQASTCLAWESATILHIAQSGVSLLGRAETQTTMQQIHECWPPYFSPDHVGTVDLDLLINSKSRHFQTTSQLSREVSQNKSYRQLEFVAWVQRGEASLSKCVWVIKYEWEWAVFTCKLWASVCHVYQTRERDKRFLTHTQVQTSPASLVSVIDALMGVGGGGRRWTEGRQVQTGTSKACWTLINKCALIRDKRLEQMKGVLMHLHLHTPIKHAFCSISSRPEEPGYHRRMQSIETVGVNESLKSVSELIIE